MPGQGRKGRGNEGKEEGEAGGTGMEEGRKIIRLYWNDLCWSPWYGSSRLPSRVGRETALKVLWDLVLKLKIILPTLNLRTLEGFRQTRLATAERLPFHYEGPHTLHVVRQEGRMAQGGGD